VFNIKKLHIYLLSSTVVIFNACTSSQLDVNKGGYYHNNIYFGSNVSVFYKEGVMDGCTTSKGVYKKAHTLFNNNSDYANGWFMGRNKCK